MTKPSLRDRARNRLDRQFNSISRQFPWAARPLAFLRHPWLWLIRVPIAFMLILGGFLAILPVFGLWMIPVGLLLLAVDVPRLQSPVAGAIVRGRRRIDLWRHRNRR
ncbi:hypothetical protein AB3Y40_03405 [Yoonia sp. R2331]|uniref:hypothetical protein n=1 Tax=Yoonia sp. R2331 TaxID=3237238 RepID=UPI0034E4BFC2